LLLADQGYTDEVIAERVGMYRRGIEGIRELFVEEGFETTFEGKERGYRRRFIQAVLAETPICPVSRSSVPETS
jgi:hypothetical protein